jgi:hypothetical protein
MPITHRLDDAYIEDAYTEKAWKHAATSEIENVAAKILVNAQEAQSIEEDLSQILYLAFQCSFKTTVA